MQIFRLISGSFIFSTSAWCTMVLFQWTPSRIYLAADSLTTKIDGGRVSGAVECKIHQVGDVFFTIVGVNNDDTNKIDLVAVAKKAAVAKGGIVDKVTAFEALAKDQIDRVMRVNLTSHLGSTEPQRVTVVFVDRVSHILVCKEYVRNSDGSTKSIPRDVYSAPQKSSDMKGVGAIEESVAALNKSEALLKLEDVPLIDAMMNLQFENEAQRLRRNQIPRVGPPICILQIERGIATWVPGYQGKCPDIEPAHPKPRTKK